MEVICFDKLESTQLFLIEQIKKSKLSAPIAVRAKNQTDGIGSRDNHWEGGDGNLYFSFAISIDDLVDDLPIESASIYFSFLIKEILYRYTSNIWLKWPNDLYCSDDKVGGTITKKIGDILVCGMGINFQKGSNNYRAVNINIDLDLLLEEFFKLIDRGLEWKQVFSKYKIEFEAKKRVFTHIDGKYQSLQSAILLEDGSLLLNNKRVYSLR